MDKYNISLKDYIKAIYDTFSAIPEINGKVNFSELKNKAASEQKNLIEFAQKCLEENVLNFENVENDEYSIIKNKNLNDSKVNQTYSNLTLTERKSKRIPEDLMPQNLLYTQINQMVKETNIIQHKNGIIFLQSFFKDNPKGKINLLTISESMTNGKIDISKIQNSQEDTNIDFFKYTVNHDDGRIDFSTLIDGSNDRINIYKLSGIFDNSGALDLGKITDKINNGKIDLFKTNFKCQCGNPKKLVLSQFTDSRNDGKIDLFKISLCIINGKIDLSKIRNTTEDDNINLFKYTINVKDGRIDLSNFIDTVDKKIDLFKLNVIIDENGKIDLTKVFDSSNESKIKYSTINWNKLFNDGELILSRLKVEDNKGKINLFNFPQCIYKGKIDLSKIRNSLEDEKVDLFKYTTNVSDGRVDLSLLADSCFDRINVYKLSRIFSDNGLLDIGKICNQNTDKSIDLFKINFKSVRGEPKKVVLSCFTDSTSMGKIDLFRIPFCISNNKINLAKICNTVDDENIDIFFYTSNHKNGMIDLAKFVDTSSEKINLGKINGVLDNNGVIDQKKIFDSSFYLKDTSVLKLKLFEKNKIIGSNINELSHPGKIFSPSESSHITNKQELIKRDCFNVKLAETVKNDSYKKPIDIHKTLTRENSYQLKSSINQKHIIKEKFDKNILSSETQNMPIYQELKIDKNISITRNKISIETEGIRKNLASIQKLNLSKAKNENYGNHIDLFKFPYCILDEKIDLAKICNSENDHTIDLFAYTINHNNGRIDLANFSDSVKGKIDLYKLNGVFTNDGVFDFGKLYDSSNNGQVNFSKIICDDIFHNGKLCLSMIKDERNQGKLDLFDFQPCIVRDRIDITKICNSKDDEKIDIIKYTIHHDGKRIIIDNFRNGNQDNIPLYIFSTEPKYENFINPSNQGSFSLMALLFPRMRKFCYDY